MDFATKIRILACLHLMAVGAMLGIHIIYSTYVEYCNTFSITHTRRRKRRRYTMLTRIPEQSLYLRKLTQVSDVDCLNNLRMDRNTFAKLCCLLETVGGLRAQRYVSIAEQVAIFLSILAHHKKVRVVAFDFKRSKDTVSKYFHSVLDALILCHELLLVKPVPIGEDCENETWKCFKGCLGALDGTLISTQVPAEAQNRYRSRKGIISVNVLGVCDPEMQFVYVLAGWEGSAADSRVLRDAIRRPTGLRVPTGNYYLCDSGYMNSEGFLTPYRGVRYHLNEWTHGAQVPQNKMEFFNMKHSRARNIIERAFGLLKGRRAILRSPAFYPSQVHNKIVVCCAMLHNFIRREMGIDPFEREFAMELGEGNSDVNDEPPEVISSIQTSAAWNEKRETLAEEMFSAWRNARRVNNN